MVCSIYIEFSIYFGLSSSISYTAQVKLNEILKRNENNLVQKFHWNYWWILPIEMLILELLSMVGIPLNNWNYSIFSFKIQCILPQIRVFWMLRFLFCFIFLFQIWKCPLKIVNSWKNQIITLFVAEKHKSFYEKWTCIIYALI